MDKNDLGLDNLEFDIPEDVGGKIKYAASIAIIVFVLGIFFAPLAWLMSAGLAYFYGNSLIRSKKVAKPVIKREGNLEYEGSVKPKVNPQGIFGFGAENDQYAMIGVAVIYLIICAFMQFHTVAALISGIATYGWMVFEERTRGRDRNRSPFMH